MIRDERWKLIEYNANGRRQTQLFDLSNDPNEMHNLANDELRSNDLARLRAALEQMGKEFEDPVREFYPRK